MSWRSIDRTALAWSAVLIALWACSPGSGAPGNATPGGTAPGGSSGAVAPAASPVPTTVRIVTQPSALSDAGIDLAEAQGYFHEAGLQIDRVAMNAVEGTTALIGGGVAIAAFPPTAGLLNATGRGVALRAVADKGQEGPGFAYQSVVVRRDLYESGAVRQFADLRGRRLALNLTGAPIEASVATGLAQNGLTLADVDIQEGLGFPEQMQALGNGALDGAVLLEPLVTQALNNHTGTILKPVWEFIPNQQVATILYGSILLEREPDLGRRWMVAYLQGVRAYNDAFQKDDPARRAEAIEVLAAATQISPALIEQIAAAGRLPALDPDGRLNLAAMRQSATYWRETGRLTADRQVDEIVDPQFTEYASQVLGPYR